MRLLDAKDRFVRWLQPEEANRLIRSGQVSMTGKGKRTLLRLLTRQGVEDFESYLRRAEKTTYAERYAGHRLVVLKRYDETTGSFRKWDPALSFDELRRGRMESEERERARRLAALDKAA